MCGNAKKPTGHGPGQPAPAGTACARGRTKWSQEVPSKPNRSVIHSTSQGSALLKLGLMQRFSQKFMEYRKSLLGKDPPLKINL